jgi:hypothetical protein
MGRQGKTLGQKRIDQTYSLAELDTIIEEATLDSYGLDEELCSWAMYLEDELVFPFPVKIIGKTVQVVGIEDGDGTLKFKIENESKIYKINVSDAEILVNPGEKNRNDLLIQAFRHWVSPVEQDADPEFEFI